MVSPASEELQEPVGGAVTGATHTPQPQDEPQDNNPALKHAPPATGIVNTASEQPVRSLEGSVGASLTHGRQLNKPVPQQVPSAAGDMGVGAAPRQRHGYTRTLSGAVPAFEPQHGVVQGVPFPGYQTFPQQRPRNHDVSGHQYWAERELAVQLIEQSRRQRFPRGSDFFSPEPIASYQWVYVPPNMPPPLPQNQGPWGFVFSAWQNRNSAGQN